MQHYYAEHAAEHPSPFSDAPFGWRKPGLLTVSSSSPTRLPRLLLSTPLPVTTVHIPEPEAPTPPVICMAGPRLKTSPSIFLRSFPATLTKQFPPDAAQSHPPRRAPIAPSTASVSLERLQPAIAEGTTAQEVADARHHASGRP